MAIHAGPVRIVVSPRLVLGAGASAAAVLIALGLAGVVLRYHLGLVSRSGLISRFDLDQELNVPTWFSSFLLLHAAYLLLLAGIYGRSVGNQFAAHWFGLSAIFVVLSIDETAALHNLATVPVRRALDLPAFLTFAWVIPMGVFLLILGGAYARFLWNLPGRTRTLFISACITYVGGAIGVEMAGAVAQAHYGRGSLFAWLALLEETAEMSGMVLFNYALADYLAAENAVFELGFAGRVPSAPLPARNGS